MIRKYSVLLCVVISVILIVVASLLYPGGSLFDKNSEGFEWSKNFISNLFATKAINGSENPGKIWGLIGMAFYSVGFGIFFIRMAKKMSSRRAAAVLKFVGATNIVFNFLIATSLHDLVVLISIVLTLVGLFTITVFILKTKLHLLKGCCIICLLTYYSFFSLFSFGYLGLAAIMQKVYAISSMLLVLGLEYFTNPEDFKQIYPDGKKYKQRTANKAVAKTGLREVVEHLYLKFPAFSNTPGIHLRLTPLIHLQLYEITSFATPDLHLWTGLA